MTDSRCGSPLLLLPLPSPHWSRPYGHQSPWFNVFTSTLSKGAADAVESSTLSEV